MIKVFNNFLPDEKAHQLLHDIEAINGGWWRDARKVRDQEVHYFIPNISSDLKKSRIEYNIGNSLTDGYFTYSFSRSVKHVDSCVCAECNFKNEFLLSETFLNFIRQEANIKKPVLFESFVSIYKRGDFLSTHTDKNRGVAFILNLTPNWRAEYGGLLHVYTEDGIKAYTPTFNSLILLGLNNGKGLNHFVSEVSQYAPRPRIAITGWYNESS